MTLTAVRYETAKVQPPTAIADAIAGLERTQGSPAWTTAADVFADACEKNGWKPS